MGVDGGRGATLVLFASSSPLPLDSVAQALPDPQTDRCGIDFRHYFSLFSPKSEKRGHGTTPKTEKRNRTHHTKQTENNKENHLTHFTFSFMCQRLPLTIKLQIQKSVVRRRRCGKSETHFATAEIHLQSRTFRVYFTLLHCPLCTGRKNSANCNYNKQRNIL